MKPLNKVTYGLILWGLLCVLFGGNLNNLYAQVKIMPLGDSITLGDGDAGSDPVGGYRDDLYDLLTAEAVNFDFVGSQSAGTFADPGHEGHPQWTADSLSEHLATWLAAYLPEIVLLMAGTNDVSSDQIAAGVVSDIEELVDIVYNYDPNTKIVLSSLIPRKDSYDAKNDSVNAGILEMLYNKLNLNYKIYYAGHNEMFKGRADWEAAYMHTTDNFHPNNAGYTVIANVYFNEILNAINVSDPIVTDNFNRSGLDGLWEAQGQLQIVSNELSNTAGDQGWKYLATYKAFTNPSTVSMKIGATAAAAAIQEGGLALMLDAPTAAANGYFLRILNTGEMELWVIENGEIAFTKKIDTISGAQGALSAGDILKVSITTDGAGHYFDCYKNDEVIGRISDPGKQKGNSFPQYAGVLLRGGFNNNIDDFNLFKSSDKIAPQTIADLTAGSASATTVTLTWTAPGDDGAEGTPVGYDIRYSANMITDSNFGRASQIANPPSPLSAGLTQSFVATGLQPNTKFYFAIKAYDEVPNMSGLSNIADATTSNATEIVDDFNRTELGSDWVAASDLQIVNGELANTSSSGDDWNFLGIFTRKRNPIEAKIKWGAAADAEGIGQGGIALMLSDPTLTTSGYLVWRRTGSQQKLYLWGIENGVLAGSALATTDATQPDPGAGDEFKVIVRVDDNGHHFDFYINDAYDGTLTDANKLYSNGDTETYAGVMLHNNRNNNVDIFSITNAVGEASIIEIIAGDDQDGAVGRALPESLVVKVTDDNANAVAGVRLAFEITGGGGHFDLAVAPDNYIRIEAEEGVITLPMSIETDFEVSNGQYITCPSGDAYEGTAEYHFYIETTGNYYVWARVNTNNRRDMNSWYFGVDGEEPRQWNPDPTRDDWFWSKVGTGNDYGPIENHWQYDLSVGWHDIKFYHGNHDAKLDKIIIVDNASWQPTGLELYPEYKTDVFGLAKAQWTMGPAVGPNTAAVKAPGLQGSPLLFTADASGDIASNLTLVSGTPQSGAGGEQLPNPLVVKVTDQYNNPKKNYPVTFVSISGGATFVETQPVHTNENGEASVNCILGTESATSIVEAQAEFDGTTLTVPFTLTATSHIASTMFMHDEDSQSGPVTSVLPKPFKVRIEDDQGNVIKNHSVRFVIIDGPGGAKFSDYGNTDQTVTTGADGIAQINYQLGTVADTNRVEARATGGGGALINSPVTFICRATAAEASKLLYESGHPQTGVANNPLASPFVVKVADEYNNGVAGHAVLFTVTAGGGNIEGQNSKTAHTDGDGLARVTLTMGSDSELKNVVVASAKDANGDPLPDPFTFEATPGLVDKIEYYSGKDQKGSAGWPLKNPLCVKVLDNYGNPVPGHQEINFIVKQGDGTFNGATDTTFASDAAGIAKGYFTLGNTPGAQYIIEVNGYRNGVPLNGNSIPFTVTAHPATQIRRISAKNSVGTCGLPLADSVKALVTDDQGIGLRKFQVDFKIVGSDGKINGENQKSVLTNSQGIAAVQWTLGQLPGSKNNIVEAHALWNSNHLTYSPLKFWATAELGPPTVLHIVQGDSQFAVVGGRLEEPLKVRVTDFAGNPFAQQKVVFTVSKGGGKINDAAPTTDQYTDPDGYAQVYWRIGDEKGDCNNELEVTSTHEGTPLSNSPHIFYASGKASPVSALKRISTETINGQVGIPLSQPFKVQTIDKEGNGVDSVGVTFEVTTGGGTLGGDTDTLVVKTSDENGFCEVYLTVGPGNGALNTVIATAYNGSTPLKNTPMYFYSTGQTGPLSLEASTITFSPNLPAVGTEADVIITTTDDFGNPIANKYVTIETSDEGTLSQPQNATDSAGKTTGKIKAFQSGIKQIKARVSGIGEFANPGEVRFIALLGSKISNTSGNGQSGNVGAVLPEPLGVQVADKYNNPVEGHSVTFLGDGQPDGNEIYEPQDENVTDSEGWAYSRLVLKQAPGQNTASVMAKDISDSKTFTATGVQGQASNIIKESGDNQTGTAGVELPLPFVVKVVDSNGWAIWNHPVEFSVDLGDGSFKGRKVRTVCSDRLGNASIYFSPDNNIGMNIVRAASLETSLTFTAHGNAGEAKKLIRISAYEQEGPVLGSPPSRLRVQTTDFYDNGIGSVEVTFSVVSGNASIKEAQPCVSNANGDAYATVIFGDELGEVMVEAASEGLINSPVPFKLYVISAGAVSMEILSGNEQPGTKGRKLPFPFEVNALDSYGNPAKNVTFTWVVMSGDGSWSDGSSNMNTRSDENGIARNSMILGPSVGSNVAYVINQNLQNSPLEFTAEGVNNNFPVIEPAIGDYEIEEGQYLEFVVNAIDDDQDVIDYGMRGSTLPTGANYDSVGTRKFSWTPNYQQAGPYNVWFVVQDNRDGIGAEEVTINVKNLNRRPVLEAYWPTTTDISGSTEDNIPVQFSVTVSDPDVEALIYQWYLNPHGASSYDSLLVGSESEYSIKPNEYSLGNYTVSVMITDTYDTLRHEWTYHNKTLVELSGFSAEIIENGQVKLSWETSCEKNNLGFCVLRSTTKADNYHQINGSIIPASDEMTYNYIDKKAQTGRTYYYKLEDVDYSGKKTAHQSIKVHIERPTTFELSQNYPNPFNPLTKIRYQLPNAMDVRLTIYNLLGQKVRTLVERNQQAGYHVVLWDGKNMNGIDVASGIYLYHIQAGKYRETRRMALLK